VAALRRGLTLAIAAPGAFEDAVGSLGEFILDWEDLRSASDASASALDFARSAFQHACEVGDWDPALPGSAAGSPPPIA
jgi:Family of unknown function (DUF5996)